MADAERKNSYYHPGGVPITPQARRFGYEFPVYVSKLVWQRACIATGVVSKHNTGVEARIWRLLQYCYEGMAKKLSTSDDFLFYEFKIHYWGRDRPNAKKMQKWKLGARLMLDPDTDGPWLYIFAPNVDTIDALERGEAPLQDSAETIHPLVEGETVIDEYPFLRNADQQNEPPREGDTPAQDNQSGTVGDEFLDSSLDQSYTDPAKTDE